MKVMVRTECNLGVGDSSSGYITAVGILTAVSTVTTTAAIHHCHLSALLDFGAYAHLNTSACAYTNVDSYAHDGLVSLA